MMPALKECTNFELTFWKPAPHEASGPIPPCKFAHSATRVASIADAENVIKIQARSDIERK